MEILVLVLMILVCFNYLLKQTNRKPYFVVLSSVVCALFMGFMWRFAIEQSKSQISEWITNTKLMLDVSVILTLEVAIQIAFCILAADIQTSKKVKPLTIRIYKVLRWFPGILIFPVLFSILVNVIFSMPEISFKAIAWSMAVAVLIIIPLGAWVIKWLIPEKEIRLEILFYTNALIAILGIISTVNGQTAVAGVSEIEWSVLLGLIFLVLLSVPLGVITYRIRINKIIKKVNKI